MIKAEKLTKYYGMHPAIQDVSFEVKKGQIMGFLGPNGAGKTTTIRILAGFLSPTKGDVKINGYNIIEDSLSARKSIGYVPENPPLYKNMSVEAFLKFHAQIKGVPKASRKKRVEVVLDYFQLADVKKKLIGKLSKGFRQRVGLAQAIVHDPPVIFLDEPTVGLDPRQIIDTRNLIKSLAGNHTVMLSTHILPEVAMTCDQVAIINEGKIIAEDTPEHLTDKMKGSETLHVEVRGVVDRIRETLESIQGMKKLEIIDSEEGIIQLRIDSELGYDIRADVSGSLVMKGFELLELRSVKLSLEDIYLKLTTEEEGLSQ